MTAIQERPLVSFVVLTYKQEAFVREAMRSALAQTYEPLEIVVSDDCSPDRTFEIVKEEVGAYKGPHRIILNRTERNLGLAGNLNQAYALASGLFFVAQAGDDISVPERTEEIVNRFLTADPPVDLVCSYFAEIDVDGRPTGFVKKNVIFVPDVTQAVRKWRCGATGACAAYRRKLYDKYGPLDERVISEDWVYSFRAWLESGIALVEKPLVLHRTHENSISVSHRRVGAETQKRTRNLRRRTAAAGNAAIAVEWLRAWRMRAPKREGDIEERLDQLVRIREMRLLAYNAGCMEAFRLMFRLLFAGASIGEAAKVFVRHVLKWE